MIQMEQTENIKQFSDLQMYPVGTRVDLLCKVIRITDMTIIDPEISYRTQIKLWDKKKFLTFYIWKSYEEVSRTLTEGEVYYLHGILSEWNGSPNFKYMSATQVTDDKVIQAYNQNKYCRLLPENKTFFIDSLAKIKDFRYRRLVEVCYGLGNCPEHMEPTAYRKRFALQENGYGSIKHHDCYPGGYINHVVGILRLIDKLEEQYGNDYMPPIARCESSCDVNWDIVRTLAYLHDLGKQHTYAKSMGGHMMFRSGTLISHEESSILLIAKYSRDIAPTLRLDYAEEQILFGGILDRAERRKDRGPEERIFLALDLLDAVMVENLSMII